MKKRNQIPKGDVMKINRKIVVKFTAALLAMFIALGVTGCNNNQSNLARVDMEKMQKDMLEADSSLPQMEIMNSKKAEGESSFKYLSRLDYSKVSDYFLLYSSEGKADEIAVIELKSKSDMAGAKASLEEHLKKRHNTFEQYEPSEVPRVDTAKIVEKEQYIALIICNNADNVKSAFLKMFEK